jgi:hypothetical protein
MWLYRVCRRLHCGLRRRVPGVAGALLAGDWNARMRRSITSHHLPCAALALTIAARHLPPASAGDLQNYRPAYATLWRSPAASYLPADATTIMRGAAVAARLLASSWEKCIVRRSLSWWAGAVARGGRQEITYIRANALGKPVHARLHLVTP